MKLYDKFDPIGKSVITTTRTDLINSIGIDGMKDILRGVFEGQNVRDVTEFITQRRLLSSYAAMTNLFVNELSELADTPNNYAEAVKMNLIASKTSERILSLWLLGLTKKGLDNIVRTEDNITDYTKSFASSLIETSRDMSKKFGELTGEISMGNRTFSLTWQSLLLFCQVIGSQTLSIRGSSKSMNGKLFEKLLLGSLLSMMGFSYLPKPPEKIIEGKKLFWLSNMDENERETDATLCYNKTAISIDIGFIGKGNPEISLDKVTRFNRYKQIAGLGHEMKTIIIVDTVSKNSDLINKAKRVDGIVLQMSHTDWTIEFAKSICAIFEIKHPLAEISTQSLDGYIRESLKNIDISAFVQ